MRNISGERELLESHKNEGLLGRYDHEEPMMNEGPVKTTCVALAGGREEGATQTPGEMDRLSQ